MATNFTYATLTTAIQNYTEVTDTTNVFTSTITDGFITDAETRILRDVNIDADRKSQTGSLVVGQEYINRRRRDDYDDGTIRIKIDSPSP
jgi:hypothetical protein